MEDVAGIKSRLNKLRLSLGSFFVEKQPLIDLMLVAAIAREPLLLVGPPGSAKSALVSKLKDALGILDNEFFAYTITPTTVPSEVVASADDSVARSSLATAKLAMLDDVFDASSAMLNLLLDVIDRGRIENAIGNREVPLHALFAACVEVPVGERHGALRDRFPLKARCQLEQKGHFAEVIAAGVDDEVQHSRSQQPRASQEATLHDVVNAHHLLMKDLGDDFSDADRRGGELAGRLGGMPRFAAEVFGQFQELTKALVREDRIFISDRKLVKFYKLLRARAWLLRDGTVQNEDLNLLAYIGNNSEEIALLAEKVPLLLNR